MSTFAAIEVSDSNTYTFPAVRDGDLVIRMTGSNAGFHAGYIAPSSNTVISATPSNIILGSGSNQATLSNNALYIGDPTNSIAAGQICAGNLGMFRNRIINGDMRIDQRNAGAPASAFGPDRFKIVGQSNANTIFAQQVQLSNADITSTGFITATQLTAVSGPTSGIISYIPFDNSNLTDTFRGASNITTVGTMQYATGLVNRNATALYLANEANVTATTAPTNYITSTFTFPSNFTVSMWLNFTQFKANTASVAFSTNTGSGSLTGALIIYADASMVLAAGLSGLGGTVSTSISLNTWVHACVTCSGNTIILYCNGNLVGSYANTFAQAGFMLGSSGKSVAQTFSGYIDDFRIYNRVLTTSEIAVLANAPSSITSAPTDQLARYYTFDNVITDSSSNASTLTQTGSTSYVSGPINQSVYLANEANIAAGGITASTNYLTGSYTQSTPVTVSFWMNMSKLPQASGQYVTPFGFYGPGGSSLAIMVNWLSSTTSSLYYGWNGVGGTSSITVGSNAWYHIVGVYNPSSNYLLYVNNTYIGSNNTAVPSSLSNGSVNGNGNFIIGNRTPTFASAFAGYIDDFRIYNRVLTQPEIAYLYGANQPYPKIPSLNHAIYLPFDSSSLADTSGNNVTATGTGTMQYVSGITGSKALYLANEANVTTSSTAATNYVTMPYTQSTPITVSYWMYLTKLPQANGQYSVPFAFYNGTTFSFITRIDYASSTTALLIVSINSVQNSSSVTIQANTWYLVTVTYIPSTSYSLYLNGNLIASVSSSVPASLSSGPGGNGNGNIIIGNCTPIGTTPFAGYIDDFRVYKTAFSQQEVAALYYGSANIMSTYTPFILNVPTSVTLYQQSIEGNNISDLLYGTSAAQPVTISCWLKNTTSNTQQFTLALNNGYLAYSGASSNNTRGAIVVTPPITSNTWQRVSFTIPGDTLGTWDNSSNLGLNLALVLGANSNVATSSSNTWQANAFYTSSNIQLYGASSNNFLSTIANSVLITGVQLEKGTVATPFEFRPLNIEMQLCQRYFRRFNNYNIGQTSNGPDLYNGSVPISMRAPPTLDSNTSNFYIVSGGAAGTVALNDTSTRGFSGVFRNGDSISFWNSASSWTAGSFTAVTCGLTAEL